MKKARRFLCFTVLPLAFSSLFGGVALAQAYPTKQITLIVPFSPGSATDIIARVVGELISKDLGQTVVVENRPGAGGSIGSSAVAKSVPDGYTLLVNSNAHAANPALYKKLPYDTLADFTGITTLATLPNVLITSPSGGYKSVAELIAAAKKKPGELNFASAGPGSATHINAEKFRSKAGVDAMHIPFNGTPPAVVQTIAGQVDYMFAPIMSVLPQITSGKLRALAVGSATRSPLLADIPTTVESGVAGSDFNFWIGLFAPSKTPPAVIQKLNETTLKALATPEVKARFATLGAEPSTMGSAQFNDYIKQQKTELGAIIEQIGLKLD